MLAISSNFPHEEDPACGIFAARQFAGLKKEGADITVIVPYPYAPYFINRFERYRLFRRRKLISFDGINTVEARLFHLPFKRAILYHGVCCYLFIRNKIRRLYQQNAFDVIYARGFWLEADLGLRLGALLNLPVVGVGIGSDVNVRPNLGEKYFEYFERIAVNLDAVMATGGGVAEKISGVRGGEVTVMGGVVDIQTFHPVADKNPIRDKLGLPQDKVIFLFAGHIIKTKGIYELVEAFQHVVNQYPLCELYFCGYGSDFNALKKTVNESSMRDHIKIVGNVEPSLMPLWMQASDVFVLPSYCEGMPNVVMEAMACGLPVVATSVGGLPQIIGGNDGVILIDPQNITVELKKAFINLVENQRLRKKMGTAAREKAKKAFGIEENSRKVFNCLEKTIESRRKNSYMPDIDASSGKR